MAEDIVHQRFQYLWQMTPISYTELYIVLWAVQVNHVAAGHKIVHPTSVLQSLRGTDHSYTILYIVIYIKLSIKTYTYFAKVFLMSLT